MAPNEFPVLLLSFPNRMYIECTHMAEHTDDPLQKTKAVPFYKV